jgi:hypothetical protein
MSDQVPTTFVTLFENNMRLALQQTQPRLYPLALPKTGTGSEKKQIDDIIGNVKSNKGSNDGRHGDAQPMNTPHTRLWVAKPDFDYYMDYVDNNDQVQAQIALQSGYMMSATALINRAKDDAFIGGFFGSMISGKDGTTLTPFPSGNVIANDVGGVSGTATGLNLAKVRGARKLLQQNYNDPEEEAYMAVTADDLDQLLTEIPVTSKDFGAEGGELRDGKLRRLMGFSFVEVETENTLFWNAASVDAGGGVRKTPFWKKSGMISVSWWDQKTSIDRLAQKHGSIQVYASVCVAASRTDSGKVGYILNKRN